MVCKLFRVPWKWNWGKNASYCISHWFFLFHAHRQYDPYMCLTLLPLITRKFLISGGEKIKIHFYQENHNIKLSVIDVIIVLWTTIAQTVKRLPTIWETHVQSLGQEDLLEKEMATHSSILAWKIPWMEKPGRLQSIGSQRVRYDWLTSLHFHFIVL